MPTWEDVVGLGTQLPGVEVTTSYGTPSLRVRRKFCAACAPARTRSCCA